MSAKQDECLILLKPVYFGVSSGSNSDLDAVGSNNLKIIVAKHYFQNEQGFTHHFLRQYHEVSTLSKFYSWQWKPSPN